MLRAGVPLIVVPLKDSPVPDNPLTANVGFGVPVMCDARFRENAVPAVAVCAGIVPVGALVDTV